ncbi:MAG: class I SAM-dependent methyltransferase [Nitrospirae bacterium]|nr:class I SAM-dependent methyltransferase [Nitrospirota bacterium]
MRSYYERSYRLKYKGTYAPKLKHVYRAGRVAADRFSIIRKHIKKGDRIIDIGSGGGEFVYLLRQLHYNARGIEPNEGYAAYSKKEYNIEIYSGFVQDFEMESGLTYDVATMFHVLEHMENPFGVLLKLKKLIAPDGRLLIEVPNAEATCQAPANRFHRAHLYNFNNATLSRLGIKAGFEILDTALSNDGANIMIFFRNAPGPGKTVDGRIEGNCNDISRLIRRHTAWRHFASGYPYSRFIDKAVRLVKEGNAIRGFSCGRDILNYYYKRWISAL